MSFRPALTEQRFLLDHIVGIGDLAQSGKFPNLSDDIVHAVLDGVGAFAGAEWAPLDRIGDMIGAQWTESGVRMPDGFARAYRAYVEAGWGAIGVAEAFGGQGLPFSLQTAALETLGTANVSFALAPMLTFGAIEAIAHHGSPEQQALYLPNLATGAWSGTMNLTEPQAGSDVGALRSQAVPLGDGRWKIRGTKIFISFGDHDLAENIVHLVLARTPGAPEGTRGISLFLVPKFRLDAEGRPAVFNDVQSLSIEHKMGLHASPTCVLGFGERDDCIGELIGREHGGMRAMFTMMNSARLNVGLQGVQVAEAATQKSIAFALNRVQSARAGATDRSLVCIAEHPDVRRMLMRMKAQTQAARTLVYYAAGQMDRAALGDPAAKARLELLTPLAKAHATDLATEVASLGIQVHGGMGYVEETGVAQHYRDARVLAIYEGTNGIQAADLVSRKLWLLEGEAFASLIADMRADGRDDRLLALINACEQTAAWLRHAAVEDRLAASYPFLTMLSVAVCGWLLERQMHAAANDDFGLRKRAVALFFLGRMVPEAAGLRDAALAGADQLYTIATADLVD